MEIVNRSTEQISFQLWREKCWLLVRGEGGFVLFSIKVSQEWSLGGVPLSSWTTQHASPVAAKGPGSAVPQNFDERTSSLTFLTPSPCI